MPQVPRSGDDVPLPAKTRVAEDAVGFSPDPFNRQRLGGQQGLVQAAARVRRQPCNLT